MRADGRPAVRLRGGRLMRVMFTLTTLVIVVGLAWFFAVGWSKL
uniref:Uncharacterized protein n=1 Tax=Nonomuraea gerenzanensis TaxID=93944 RepID=A0A1M4E485_9ACTN|nr:hypothetical protein BN4615_P3163 [Nonomuraea gerenzanensis]